MKLYTEEDVLNMLRCFHTCEANVQLCMLKLTPIELPSNEEIEMASIETYRDYPHNSKEHPEWLYSKDINAPRKRKAFNKGAKWMRYKIGGSNEQ